VRNAYYPLTGVLVLGERVYVRVRNPEVAGKDHFVSLLEVNRRERRLRMRGCSLRLR